MAAFLKVFNEMKKQLSQAKQKYQKIDKQKLVYEKSLKLAKKIKTLRE